MNAKQEADIAVHAVYLAAQESVEAAKAVDRARARAQKFYDRETAAVERAKAALAAL